MKDSRASQVFSPSFHRKLALPVGAGLLLAAGGCSNDPLDSPEVVFGTGGVALSGGVVASGGLATGGALGSGGVATGGVPTGGVASGGLLGSGGVATGGVTTGGVASGGAAESGGQSTGGSESGGMSASGGASSGGAAMTGGDMTMPDVRADGYRMVWNDEFDGSAIDMSKWSHEVNCWGGGNNEDQCYVPDEKNSYVENGYLNIVALKDSPSGAINDPGGDTSVVTKGHSSARLRTKNKGDFKYGRIEARAKLPYGQGLWPAFWMLPTDETYGGWARSGEIDIMEAVNLRTGGETDNRVYGTLHYGGSWPNNTHTGSPYDPADDVTENFHTYAVEWEEGEIRWFVDDHLYATQTDWYSDGGAYPAPFDQRFHILLNVAVGGQWPGPPNGDTVFPQRMVVDYVRVYTCDTDPSTGHGCGTR